MSFTFGVHVLSTSTTNILYNLNRQSLCNRQSVVKRSNFHDFSSYLHKTYNSHNKLKLFKVPKTLGRRLIKLHSFIHWTFKPKNTCSSFSYIETVLWSVKICVSNYLWEYQFRSLLISKKGKCGCFNYVCLSVSEHILATSRGFFIELTKNFGVASVRPKLKITILIKFQLEYNLQWSGKKPRHISF